MDNGMDPEAKAFLIGLAIVIVSIISTIITCKILDDKTQIEMANKGLCYIGSTYLPCDIKK